MTSPTETWLTQKQAAELAGCSLDTIRRYRRDGKLGVCRQDQLASNAWMIPLSGLATAGLYTPSDDEDPVELLGQRRAERDLATAATDLAVERARREQLELRIRDLTRQNDELVKLLRRLNGGEGRAA